MKQARLSEEELTKVIAKLRSEYDRLSKEMDDRLFDRKAFEERYITALRNRTDLQTFLFAEMTAMEDKKKIFDQREREYRIRTEKTFTKKIDRMIEEMAEKTRKYPFLFEDSGVSEEVGRLCGALDRLYHDDWIPLAGIMEKDDLKSRTRYNSLDREFLKFLGSSGRSLPLEVDRYLVNTEREKEEKAERLFLKDAAILLSWVIELLQDLQEFRSPDDILQFSGSPERPSKFNGLKRSDAWDLVGRDVSAVIGDFRFSELI